MVKAFKMHETANFSLCKLPKPVLSRTLVTTWYLLKSFWQVSFYAFYMFEYWISLWKQQSLVFSRLRTQYFAVPGKWSLHEPRASRSSNGNLSLERPKIFLKCRKYNGLYFLTSFWCLQANSSIMEFLFFQPLRFKRLVDAMYFHDVILWDLSLAIKDN